MSDYHLVWEALCDTIGEAEAHSKPGSFEDMEHMTVDQRLKACEVAALLAIAQELNRIHHQGINPDFSSAD